jgi:rSAM/selenodomain-associated transferase 1
VGTLQLWCAPDTFHPFLQDCARRYGAQLRMQGEGNIGQRMHLALADAHAKGFGAVLIGSDSPALRPEDLRAAAAALQEGCDAAFVPAEDGGYVLIAASQAPETLFDGIEWGSGRVMAQTRERLLQLRWRWRELPPRWDVDRPEDYERLMKEGWPFGETQPS